jgi:hypothetical protein
MEEPDHEATSRIENVVLSRRHRTGYRGGNTDVLLIDRPGQRTELSAGLPDPGPGRPSL